MKRNVWFLGLLVCVLTLGALLAGCNTTTGADKWAQVTSLRQLDGTWKYSYTETQTLQEWAESATDYLGDVDFEFDLGDLALLGVDPAKVRASIKVEGTQTINAGAKTAKSSGKVTVTFSGDGSDALMIGISLISGTLPDDVKIDILKKTITMDIESEPYQLDDVEIAELLANTQINQAGTKIKITEPFSGSREIIATKQ